MNYLPPIAALACAGYVLVSCANVGSQSSSKATVVAAEAAIAAAGQVALPYMALPPCGTPTAPALCSSPQVKANIRSAYDAAYTAATGAQKDADAGTPVDTVALNAAIATLQSAVAALPKQGS